MIQIKEDIRYIGVNDYEVDLFEGQYKIPGGISYNSYVILDDKIAVFDTVDEHFSQEWLDNIERTVGDKMPDYLIVSHMEPDHSANILAFKKIYPNAKIVSSKKSFVMMKNFFGDDFSDSQVIVGEGDTLSLGKHQLTFLTAPMVHWPEVIVTYDSADKVLFSADAFGKFGVPDDKDNWAEEARRYYIGIVGKYGTQVQSLLKKASEVDIETICPLHGPVLSENLGTILELYNKWSSYIPETDGVLVAYASVYGHTKKAAELLAETLEANGCPDVVLLDLARCDMSKAVAEAFRLSKIVFAAATYNAEVFPPMREFINELKGRNFSNRTVAFIENGSWAPTAAKYMKGMLENSKNLTFAEQTVTILSSLNDESMSQLERLSRELLA